jgi:septal ring factor EnvC (AmiA/AmiB activator)
MRDELTRLRRVNLEYEEEIARHRSEIVKVNERLRSFSVEMETKDHELMNLTELVNRRKQEVINTQQENDRLMSMLRNMTDQKDHIDAQKLMTEEKYMVVVIHLENGQRDTAVEARKRPIQVRL